MIKDLCESGGTGEAVEKVPKQSLEGDAEKNDLTQNAPQSTISQL